MPLRSILLFALLTGLAACSAQPGPAPSSTNPVSATPEGLTQLFRRECLEQRNLVWVRSKFDFDRSSCSGGPGERGDCEQEFDLRGVYWSVQSTTRRTISIRMDWNRGERSPIDPLGPPPGRLSCEIEVPEPLGASLHEAAIRIASIGYSEEPVHRTFNNLVDDQKDAGHQQDEAWIWVAHQGGDPQIELYHNLHGGTWSLRYAYFGHSTGLDPRVEPPNP
jgi:hypothetical protein